MRLKYGLAAAAMLGSVWPGMVRAQVQLNPAPNYAAALANSYAQGQAIAAQRAQVEAIQSQQALAERAEAASDVRQDRSRRVGQLVGAGQCEQARSLAVSEGDFDMAVAALQVCRPLASGAQQ